MVRFAHIITLATSAVALVHKPRQVLESGAVDSMTYGEASSVCGSNLELNCCNKESDERTSPPEPKGLLGNLLGGILGEDSLGLFDQCSPLDPVGNIIGAGDLLNNYCRQKVACCESNPIAGGGLINIGLPYLALGGIL